MNPSHVFNNNLICIRSAPIHRSYGGQISGTMGSELSAAVALATMAQEAALTLIPFDCKIQVNSLSELPYVPMRCSRFFVTPQIHFPGRCCHVRLLSQNCISF